MEIQQDQNNLKFNWIDVVEVDVLIKCCINTEYGEIEIVLSNSKEKANMQT